MVDLAISLPMGWNWILPMVFGIGTGLPIMIIAWLIAYSAVPMAKVKERLHHIEKWVRYVSAALFIGFGVYLSVHLLAHGHDCGCEHPHCEVRG
jgi:threonine/homoserine/homoserine lactone efflux protein